MGSASKDRIWRDIRKRDNQIYLETMASVLVHTFLLLPRYGADTDLADVTVETYLIPPQTNSTPYHTRLHKISTSRTLLAADSGFAIHSHSGPIESERRMPVLSKLTEEAHGRYESPHSGLGHSRVGISGVIDLLGTGRGRVHDADGNSNTNDSRTVIPSIVTEVKGEMWLATRVFALPEGSVKAGWLEEWERCGKRYDGIDELKHDLGL